MPSAVRMSILGDERSGLLKVPRVTKTFSSPRYTFNDRAGLSGLHFHELRHTFATLALESRALTMYELSVAMGHDSEAATNKVYAHLRKRDYSAHRAAFSAHIAAQSVAVAPVKIIGS